MVVFYLFILDIVDGFLCFDDEFEFSLKTLYENR